MFSQENGFNQPCAAQACNPRPLRYSIEQHAASTALREEFSMPANMTEGVSAIFCILRKILGAGVMSA
jgi:hypothetical protein